MPVRRSMPPARPARSSGESRSLPTRLTRDERTACCSRPSVSRASWHRDDGRERRPMTSFVETGTILDRILARTAQDLEVRTQHETQSVLERMAAERATQVSLSAAVRTANLSVIAEFKRASPSKGRFPFDAGPSEVAAQYFAGGAAAISVLIDGPFFEGSVEDLQAAATVAHTQPHTKPVLRKD